MCRLTVFIIIAILVTGWATADLDDSGLLRIKGRIIGGEQTTIDKFPYQISIRYLGSHRCGGCLIQPNYMITAGHCVAGAITLFLRFVAGSSYRNSGGEDLYVGKIFLHEKYNATSAENDIAVVRMDGFFEYTDTIQPILMASQYDRFRDGTKAVISGWGTESEGAAAIPVQLRYTHVYAFNHEECNTAYTEIGPITPGMICAWYPGGGKDACQGDSGGPLVVADKLVGIVSWGIGCARGDYPGVYTEVAHYRRWVDAILLS